MRLPQRPPQAAVEFFADCITYNDIVKRCQEKCGNGCGWNAALTHPHSCNHLIDPETCTEDHKNETRTEDSSKKDPEPNPNIVESEN